MPDRGRRAVVLLVNGLGDHLMMIPVMRALSQVFAGRLTIVGLPHSQYLFSDVPAESRVAVQLSGVGRSIDVDECAARIGNADVLVSLNRTNTSDILRLAERIEAKVTAGLFPDYGIHVPFDQSTHAIDLAFRIVQRFDEALSVDDFAWCPSLKSGEERALARFAGLIPTGARVLIVHADTSIDKQWDYRRFQRLLDRFLASRPDYVALVLGQRSIGLEAGSTRRIFLALGLPLNLSLGLITLGTAFVGIDSALLHAADLFRLPSTAIFGAGDHIQFGCRFCVHEHVTAVSMAHIRVDDVFDAPVRVTVT